MRPPASIRQARGRASILLMLFVALIASGAAWWYFAPASMPAWLARALPPSPRLGPALYTWRDDKGRLHATDRPPTGRPYETVRYDPDTNVVPGGSSKE